uniref:Uncharacterized protein n=1 Tax=Caenorhabditis tropicalis TaxID=1561998 RepID=A0A1I7TWR7_9PELO
MDPAGPSHISLRRSSSDGREIGERQIINHPSTRKRAHSISEEEITPKPRPLCFTLPDGTRVANYQGYLERGFGWVTADDSTRATWKEFVNKAHKSEVSIMDDINRQYPNWMDPEFSLVRRSRSRSRSPTRSPSLERSPTPDSDSDTARYRSRSQTPVTETNTPMTSPDYENSF